MSTWCNVTGCHLHGVKPHGHAGGSPTPTPPPPMPPTRFRCPDQRHHGPVLTMEAHDLPPLADGGRRHVLSADCWCMPTVKVEHRPGGPTTRDTILGPSHRHQGDHCAECCTDDSCPSCWAPRPAHTDGLCRCGEDHGAQLRAAREAGLL